MPENESANSDETKKVSDDSDSPESSGNESKLRLLEDADLTRPSSKEDVSSDSKTRDQKTESQTTETQALADLLAQKKAEQERAERTTKNVALPDLVLTDFKTLLANAAKAAVEQKPGVAAGAVDETARAGDPVKNESHSPGGEKPETQPVKPAADQGVKEPGAQPEDPVAQAEKAVSQQEKPEAQQDKQTEKSETPPEKKLDDPKQRDADGEKRAHQIIAEQLREAIQRGDQKQVRDILEPLSKAERDAIKQAYQEKYGNNRPDALAGDLRGMRGDQGERLANLLRGDGTRADDASRLDLEFRNLRNGDRAAELRIREILATQNADGNKKLAEEYERLTGKKLEDAVKDSNLSDATKQAFSILMKGTDGRSVEENKTLARIGLQHGDIQMMELGLRGTEPNAVRAREDLNNDRDFVQQLNNKFGNDAVARDILRHGRISLETIANLNNGTGLFGSSNRLNLEHALRTATPDERRAYASGREMDLEIKKTGQTPELTEQQRRDLEFYRRTHAALEAIASGRAPSSDLHSTDKPDPERILRDKLGLKDGDLQRLSDPNFRRELESRLPTNPAERALVKSLMERAARGEDIKNLSPAEKLLYEKVSGASPARTLLTAEEMLKADPEMRERLRRLNANPGFEPVFRSAEDAAKFYKQREQDLALLNVIRGAAHDSAGRAERPVNGLDPVNRSVSQLLSSGRLDALSAASLGLPPTIVRERLAEADERTRNFVETRFADQYGRNAEERRNAEVSRLEDVLIRGGSLAGTLAAVRGKPEDIFRAIEGMSPEDYERGRNPEHREQMRREIERALDSPNVSPEVRARALELYDQKVAADSYVASLDVRRSPLLVDSANKQGLVESVASMSPRDQLRYREDPEFRSQVDEKIQKDLTGEHRAFAQMMLERLKNEGTVPSLDKMTPTERLLYRSITGGDKFEMLKDLEAVLADPAARARIRAATPGSGSETDFALRQIALKVSTDLASAEGARTGFAPLFNSLMRDGKISDLDYIKLPLPASDRIARIAALERTNPESAAALMHYVVGSDPLMRRVLENVRAQNGEVKLTDRIAAGDIKDLSALRRELSSMTPEQIKTLREEYATKYGRSLDADVLAKMPDKDRASAVAVLSGGQGDGRQYYFDALGRLADSSTGYAPDGTQQTARRELQIYAEQLQRAAFEGRNLTPQDQEILRRAFEQALSEFKGSKEEYAQRLLRYGEAAVLVASALLLTAASAGALSPAALAAIAAAGTALTPAARIAVLKFVEGKDFDNNPNRMLRELGIGLVEGALAFGPFAAEAAISMAARSAARAAESVRASFGLDQAARVQIDNALRKPIEEALKAGRTLTQEETVAALRAAGIPEERIKTIAPIVRRDANAAIEESAFNQRLAERTRARASEAPQRTPEEALRNLLRNGVDDLRTQVGDKLPEMQRRLDAAQRAFESGNMKDAERLINEYLQSVGKPPKNFAAMINDENRMNFIRTTLREDAERLRNVDALLNGGRPVAGGAREPLSHDEIVSIINGDLSKLFNKSQGVVDQAVISRLQQALKANAPEPRVLAETFNIIANRATSDEEKVRGLLAKAKDLPTFERNLPALERELMQAGLNPQEARRMLDLVKKELELLRQGRGVLDVTGSSSQLVHAFQGKPSPEMIRDVARNMNFPSEQARQNFIKSAEQFFSKTNNNEHGFQILKGADGNYMLARMGAGNAERDSLKVFIQPLRADGTTAAIPGGDQSLHMLFRRVQGADGETRFALVEMKQGSTDANRILYQLERRHPPFVNDDAVREYLQHGNWRSVEEMVEYFNRLVRGVQY